MKLQKTYDKNKDSFSLSPHKFQNKRRSNLLQLWTTEKFKFAFCRKLISVIFNGQNIPLIHGGEAVKAVFTLSKFMENYFSFVSLNNLSSGQE